VKGLSEAIERLKANYTNDEEEREEAGYIEPGLLCTISGLCILSFR
jgi:hypothetical protein